MTERRRRAAAAAAAPAAPAAAAALPRPGSGGWEALWERIWHRTTPWPGAGFAALPTGNGRRPARRPAPLLLTCEHASPAIPAAYGGLGLPRAVLRSHRAWDIGTLEVLGPLARALDAPAVHARFSRLLIDPNRAPEQRSRIVARMDGRPVPLNRGLPPRERNRREALYTAYHQGVDAAAGRLAAAHDGRFTIVALHSFTDRLAGRVRDFDVGILFDAHEELARDLGRRIARHGLRVRYNQPYSGRRGLIYSAQRHADRWGVPPLEIEINQRLIRTERGRAPVTAALVDALRGLIGEGGG